MFPLTLRHKTYTSRNETERTVVITCNVANLGYVSSFSNDRTLIEDFNLVLEQRKNSKLIQTISDNCYSIIGIGNADFYGYTGETIGNIETGRTLNGDTVETLFLNKTAIYPFVTPSNNSEAALMLTQLEYLQHSENIPVGGTFVIAHFTCPHTPHLFFADGTTATSTNPSNYLEHFIFATTQMKKIIATILENDPSAKIALVSDHGNKGCCEEYTVKVRCFAALYNGNGEKIDIEGYSGINIMTVLLNQTFGTDYPFVPYVMQEEVLSH